MIDYCPDFFGCSIVVAGDVMLDIYHWGEVDRISPEAPVPVVRVRKKTYTLGGAGNVALNLAGLGCAVSLVGVRGDDIAGSMVSKLLAEKGIEDKVAVMPDFPTTTKTRVVGQGQQLLRLDEEVLQQLSADVEEKLLADFESLLGEAAAVILSDYNKGIFSGGLTEVFIARCAAAGVPLFVDPKGEDWSRYAHATCVTPNRREFQQVCRTASMDPALFEEQGRQLLQRFDLGYLLVTRGGAGMSLFGKDIATQHFPAEAREVFDVSGAGDTVVSVAAAAFGCGLAMEDSARLANHAAGIVVEKVGTSPVSLLELEAALRLKRSRQGDKLFDREEAVTLVRLWQKRGQRVVFTNGCFDLLHTGHVKLLHAAAKEGDKLVVGINSDESVQRLKGPGRPVLPEKERAAMLSAIGGVDMVVLFTEDTPRELIAAVKPEVLVKGGDYTPETVVGGDIVKEYGGRVCLVPLKEGFSTTNIINSVKHQDD